MKHRYKHVFDEFEEYGKDLPWYLSWVFALKRIFSNQASKKKILLEYCDFLSKLSRSIDLPISIDNTGLSTIEIDKLFIEIPLEIIRKGSEIQFLFDIEEQYFNHRKRLAYAIEIDRAVKDGIDAFSGSDKKYYLNKKGFEDNQKIILLGNPGSGKSTTLNYTLWKACIAYLNQEKENAPLPIYIKCRDFTEIDDDTSFEEIIRSQVKLQQRGDKWTNELTNVIFNAIEQGNVIVFIDGLDEIASIESRLKFCKQLVSFSNSFSQINILITSRIVGFNSVKELFGIEFDIFSISDLASENKREYIKKWTENFLEEEPERSNKLIDIVCNSRNISRLTENILMLTVICQLYFKNRSLPHRRVDVYRKAIFELVDRRQFELGDKQLSVNEVLPQLEFLAFQMRKRGVQGIEYDELIRLLRNFRKENADIQELFNREPEELIYILQNYSGIINCAGKTISEKGIEKNIYQFSHQSLQEYLAGQALLHGWIKSERNKTHAEKIRNIISNIEVKEILVENLKWRNATEVVLAEYWQESIRMYIAELDEENASTCIDLILDSHFIVSDQSHQRACSVFAAQCLVEEPKVKSQIVERVLDSLIDCLNELDGYDTRKNTSIDEVFYALSQSKWNYLIEKKLFTKFKQSRFERQNHVGRVFASYLNFSGQVPANSELNVEEFNYILNNKSEDEIIKYCMKLMEFCFQHHTKKSFLEKDINELKEIKREVFKLFNKELNQPLSLSIVWMLSWMTNAKEILEEEKNIYLEPEEIKIINGLNEELNDDNIKLCTSLLVTQKKEMRLTEDWIYNFAVIADGAKSWKTIKLPKQSTKDHYIEKLLKNLESSNNSKTKTRISIALGRLIYFPVSARKYLWELFLDKKEAKVLRNEAISYLSFSNSKDVANNMYKVYLDHYNDEDDWIASRCYLCSIGMGNSEVIKKLLLQKLEQKEHNLDDKYPPSYVLIAKNDKNSKTFIKSILEGENENLKKVILKAKEKSKDWISG